MMTILDHIYVPIILLFLLGLSLYICYALIIAGFSILLCIWKMFVDLVTLKSLRQTLRGFRWSR